MRVHYWQHKERTRTKSNKRGKVKYYPKEKSKGNPSVSTKKRDTWRKITSNFKHGLRKKGNQISFVCYESNMVDVNHNTRWIDFGSTIHISNTLQGMQNLRKSVGSEQYIYSRNKMRSHVEAIGTCTLVLSSGLF